MTQLIDISIAIDKSHKKFMMQNSLKWEMKEK